VSAAPKRRPARVRVRRATPADARAVAAVMRAAVRRLAAPFYPPAQIAAWSRLPALYHRWAMTAGGETYLVAERDRRVVGYAALAEGEVTAVFVHPSAARAGIGRALLARVEREARRTGALRLHVLAARSAVEFYAAAGYAGARSARVPLPGGDALAAFRMTKRLPAG
jgi:putative acetyltransferase